MNPVVRATERVSVDMVKLGVKMFLPRNTRLEIVGENDAFITFKSVLTGIGYSLWRPAYDAYLKAGALHLETAQGTAGALVQTGAIIHV